MSEAQMEAKVDGTTTGGNKAKAALFGVLRFLALLMLLYFFICSLTFLTASFRLIAGKAAGSVFQGNDLLSNPIVGLVIGVLFTVLVQSSSTCTSVIVSMVASGIISVKIAIPMIMGANIGTSMTSSLVSLTHITNGEQYERAFSAATVHDCFNFLSVIVLLTIEVTTGYLYHFSSAIVQLSQSNGTQTSFKKINILKAITKPLTDKVIKLDKSILTCWGKGGCQEDHYRLLKFDCSAKKHIFQNGTHDVKEFCHFIFNIPSLSDSTLGFILLIISLLLLSTCLVLIVKTLRSLLDGAISRVLKRFINASVPYVPWLTGYIAIIAGAIMTFIVQSSSVFTSVITPMVGVGLITVDRVYPLTLGSNIGTTATALLAAFASGKTESMQIALCHLLFNISGIVLFYPIPFTRFPLVICKKLGSLTAEYSWFAAFYILTVFFVVPGCILGLSVAGNIPLLIVLCSVFAILLVAMVINIIQRKRPQWLPKKLQTWDDCLPLWMHSLKPMDEVISKISGLCCKCWRTKEKSSCQGQELNGIDNYAIEQDHNVGV